ncbi:MAG: hypothetical protein ACT4NY_12080 [Pseudonocardiales bacterium]
MTTTTAPASGQGDHDDVLGGDLARQHGVGRDLVGAHREGERAFGSVHPRRLADHGEPEAVVEVRGLGRSLPGQSGRGSETDQRGDPAQRPDQGQNLHIDTARILPILDGFDEIA